MPVPSCLKNLTQDWSGPSKLHLSWLEEGQSIHECDSTLHIALDPQGESAIITYTWSEEGEPQNGHIIVNGSPKTDKVAAAWVDSWHQNSDVMRLEATGFESDSLSFRGNYSVPGHPDWGWGIELIPGKDKFELKMTNISPEGEEEWAVHAIYTPAT